MGHVRPEIRTACGSSAGNSLVASDEVGVSEKVIGNGSVGRGT